MEETKTAAPVETNMQPVQAEATQGVAQEQAGHGTAQTETTESPEPITGREENSAVEQVQQGITLPGESATEADINDFYSKIGGVSSLDDIKLSDTVPEELRGTLSQDAVSMKLTKQQIKWAEQRIQQSIDDRNNEAETFTNKIKNEWGNDYDSRMSLIKEGLNAVGAKEESFNNIFKTIGNDMGALEAFERIGKMTQEGTMAGADGAGAGYNPEQEYDDYTREHYDILYDISHRDNKMRKNEQKALFNKMHDHKVRAANGS